MTLQDIGRYEVESEIGRGGMAIVYLAHDPLTKRQVAIKILPHQFTFDATLRARFQREAETVAALEHPAIVPIYDVGEDKGQPYIVMRHMTGGSLSDRIAQGPLPPKKVAQIVERIASALDRAHGQNMIHRDLKPSNILFDQYGDAYLADFGIVKISEAAAQLTGTGVVGTPHYMAPEMASSGELTPQIDIYALGVTLFEMLTGELPYNAETPMGILLAHSTKPVPDIHVLRSGLPSEVQAVVERAMAKDPLDRYPLAGEMSADLNAVVEGKGLPQAYEVTEEFVRPTAPPPPGYMPVGESTPLGEPTIPEMASPTTPPQERTIPEMAGPTAPPQERTIPDAARPVTPLPPQYAAPGPPAVPSPSDTVPDMPSPVPPRPSYPPYMPARKTTPVWVWILVGVGVVISLGVLCFACLLLSGITSY